MLCATLLTGAAFAAPAHAAPADATAAPAGFAVTSPPGPSETPWLVRNVGTGECLSGNGNSAVYTVPWQRDGEQYCGLIGHHKWVIYTNGSEYIFRNVGTGECLSGNGNSAVYTVPWQRDGEQYCGLIAHHRWALY